MVNFNSNIQLIKSVSIVEKLFFIKHLAVMLRSDIPLQEAIQTIKDDQTNQYFQTILTSIAKDVANGKPLWKSLAGYNKIFDPLYINLIKIGEESGSLEANLDYLAIQLKKNYDFRNKVQTAFLYPAIVLSAAALVGGGVTFFVLPQLLVLFKSLDVELPLSTRVLLFIAQTVKDHGILLIISIIGLIFGGTTLISLPKIKPYWHRFLLSLPYLGKLLQTVESVAMCRNLGMMLKSGLPISVALKSQYEATTNLVFKEYLKNLSEQINKGKTIYTTLRAGDYKYIPPFVNKMIGVGEKSGKLSEAFTYLADFFEEESDDITKNLSAVMEPVILLLVGLVVAFIALSIISPIYQLTSGVRK